MANKRMFTKKICDSDAFLELPLSTQALYFHLNMNADDDGFIGNPRKIARLIGASEDELKLLIAKRFCLVFDSGVIVIKHWRMHNTLSTNRYFETQYLEEKGQLLIKENGSYSFTNGEAIDDTKKIASAKRQNNAPVMDVKLLDVQKTQQRRTKDATKTHPDKDIDKDLDKEIDKDKTKQSATVEDLINDYSSNESIRNALHEWIKMRTGKKVKTSCYAMELALDKLQGLSHDDQTVLEIINTSTLNGWTSFYALKKNNNRYTRQQKLPEYYESGYDEPQIEMSDDEKLKTQKMLKKMGEFKG